MATSTKFNYVKTLAQAQAQVKKFGRAITFVQLKTTPDSVLEPWFGSSTPRTSPLATLETFGAFVEPESLERLSKQSTNGEFIKSAEQVIIVSTPEDLLKYDEVIDSADGASYKIYNIQTLRPGDTNVLHYVRVQRRGKTTAVRGALA